MHYTHRLGADGSNRRRNRPQSAPAAAGVTRPWGAAQRGRRRRISSALVHPSTLRLTQLSARSKRRRQMQSAAVLICDIKANASASPPFAAPGRQPASQLQPWRGSENERCVASDAAAATLSAPVRRGHAPATAPARPAAAPNACAN
jgi:hypothetical protein